MKILFRAIGLALILTTFGLGAAYVFRHEVFRRLLELPAYTHEIGEHRRFMVPMRDGVRLHTQVFEPAGTASSHPTVLIRNPYNIANVFGFVCEVFVRYGYACVHQDVRGRMDSEGEWSPLVHERDDGIDTLAWLVAQPFQDGHIALYGMSYLAAVQWSVADSLPPQVKTMIPMVFATDQYPIHYAGGMYRLEIFAAWAALMPGDSMRLDHGDEYTNAVRHRPHAEVDERFFGRRLPWYRGWIGSPDRQDDLWSSPALAAFRAQPEKTERPVLMIGGWYDFFLRGQIDDFERLGARDKSRLVIGPWHHLQRSIEHQEGDIGLGGQWAQVLNWLDHHLRGGPLEGPVGVVQTFAYGEGRWRTRPHFPPLAANTHRFYLADLPDAAQCKGGRLSATATASTAPSTSFRYDPNDPVPGRGGATMLAFAFRTFRAVAPGPRDITGICDRPDVLSFATEPLVRPLRLVGSPQVRLRVASDAPDTAFTAKLIEVRPDGTAIHVRDGIRSLAYRQGRGEGPPVAYTPWQTVDLDIELWPIEWTFKAGSRIRLDVSSSNFPVYHAHPNRSGLWSAQTGADIAVNTVYGGSWLELPEPDDAGRRRADEAGPTPIPRRESAARTTTRRPRGRGYP